MIDDNGEELSWEEYKKHREQIIRQTQDILYNEFGENIPYSIADIITNINYMPYINLVTLNIIKFSDNIIQSQKMHALPDFCNLNENIQKKLEEILPLPDQMYNEFKDSLKIFTDKIVDNEEISNNFFRFIGEYISMLNYLRDSLASSMGLYDDIFNDLEE